MLARVIRFATRTPSARLADSFLTSDQRILFVHIPKTAGMSLYAALESWAGTERALRFGRGGDDRDAYRALPQARLDELRLLSGHLSLPTFRLRDLTGWSPITLLRDPVERTLSVYAFVSSNRSHPWHATARGMQLPEFVDWLRTRPANIDQQCQFITSGRSAEEALAALDRDFAIAATVEHLGPFLARLSTFLATPINVGIVNRSRRRIHREEVDAATLATIQEMNEQDSRLYDRVRERGLVGWMVDAPVSVS